MKTADVKIGAVYAVKVSGKVQPVRIDKEIERRSGSVARPIYKTAWYGTNLATNREIYIRSAAKLRYELYRDPAMSSRWIAKNRSNAAPSQSEKGGVA